MPLTCSDEEFRLVVKRNISIQAIIRDLGRATVGSNYRLIRKKVAELGLDTTHWKGMSHSTSVHPRTLSAEQVLVQNSPYSTARAKGVVLRNHLLPLVCEVCQLPPVWNEKPLVLRLDHKNGVRRDHRLNNLRFLCPNCDSQTDTFCGRNKLCGQSRKPPKCSTCGARTKGSKRCRRCAVQAMQRDYPSKTKIEWPPIEELKRLVESTSYSATARKLGVTDNAIRKHLRSRARAVQGAGL